VRVLATQSYVPPAERDAFNRCQPFAITTLPERGAGNHWRLGRLRAIAAAVRADSPSILVASGQRALWMATAVQALYGQPWVAIGHGSEFIGRSFASAAFTRRALASATAVVAVSEYTAGLIRRAARPRRLVVIPNAADGERFHPGLDTASLRREWGIDGRPVLLTVGQVGERKAQDVVIRALPRILAAYPEAVYVMAGLPRRRAEFAALAEELGVADRVRFLGVVPDADLPAVYNLADLFVLVSRQTSDDVEGYGIVVQEAALCAVPAVVSRDCGLTEAIREGVTGLSAPPDRPDATAEAVLALLGDESRRRRMGREARWLALEATWLERVADYDRVLRGILSSEPGARAEGSMGRA
jgi:phosphatidylinositol alpha-1,6-mannosyltransferase